MILSIKLQLILLRYLKKLEAKDLGESNPDIQIRHTYPPVWNWPVVIKLK